MPSLKRKFGDFGEIIACDYLTSKGYHILDRNYLKRWGEIDIVARDKDNIVFIEVKTRDSIHLNNYLPEQSVNRDKIRKLTNICESYLEEKGFQPNQYWQIDVIAISIDKNTNKYSINHIQNAVFGKEY